MANTLPTDPAARLFSATPANDPPPVPDYNICPTQTVAVVTAEATACCADALGLRSRHWVQEPDRFRSLLINAHSETVAEKPAFRAAVRERRCLVPVSGFYEWHRTKEAKLPWYASRSDGTPPVLGGSGQDWGEDGLPTLAILTTAANWRWR
ncbi:MAG: SOS response-associated peptidase family protein [Paracoccaceae bacterium]